MFFRCKTVSDQYKNGQLPPISDPETLELQDFNENRPDNKLIDRFRGTLKKLIFLNYRFLLQNQEVPTLFYEYIIKLYPGGSEFDNYIDFINNVISAYEHPYRSNDLNFRVRMISYNEQIMNFITFLIKRVISGENIKDPQQALTILKTLSSPNGVAYNLVHDSLFRTLENEIRSRKYFIARFFFRYIDHQIYIEKFDSDTTVLTHIDQYDTLPEKDKGIIVYYMSLIATIAEGNIMEWLTGCFIDKDLPIIELVTNTHLDFKLRSQFLKLVLNSFINIFRSRTIHSNNYYDISQEENNIGDEFWEMTYEKAEEQIKQLYPIMLETSQDISDMYRNVNFEIQKARFFSSMLKFNMFFEMDYNPEEWAYKVFDHCLKMIFLCLAHTSTDLNAKRRNRAYEVNENFPLDYPSQKSVFHLHFWFKRNSTKATDPNAVDSLEANSSSLDEKSVKHFFSNSVMKKVLQEALETFHYLVEARQKFFCKAIADLLHEELWEERLKRRSFDFLSHDELIKYSNET